MCCEHAVMRLEERNETPGPGDGLGNVNGHGRPGRLGSPTSRSRVMDDRVTGLDCHRLGCTGFAKNGATNSWQ